MDCPKNCPNYEKVKCGETTYALGGRLKTIESFCCAHIKACEMWQKENEKPKWTKTSDSLPPEPENKYSGYGNDHYICTVRNDQVVAMDYVRTIVRGKTVFRWEWNDRISPWDVIAWMPYPKPYKG